MTRTIVGAPGGTPFALHQGHPHRARVPRRRCHAAYWPAHDNGVPMPYLQHIAPITALIAGVLILVMPKLLNYIIALYLIVIGLVGLFGR
jgi:Protein of unknown function (DUF3096)